MGKYLPIFLLTFVNVIGFSLLIPVMPVVAEKYVDPSLVGVVYGGLISSYALFQFLFAPILGSLSDKYGRKPVLMLSQAGTTLSWVIFGIGVLLPDVPVAGLSLPLIVVALSRVVDGITGGNISAAQAWVSDMTEPKDRTRVYGLLGATFGIGFLFGPAIGGISSSTPIGFLGTAIVAFLISAVTLIVMARKLPESLPEQKRDRELHIHFARELNILHKISGFSHNKFVTRLLLIRVFFALVFSSYTTIIILYLNSGFGLGQLGLGLMMSIIGIYSIFNQAYLINRFVRARGELFSVYLGIVLTFSGLLILPLIPTGLIVPGTAVNMSLVLVMINAYFLNLGITLSMPTFKTLLTSQVAPTKQGVITGIDESLLALGQGVTPILAGGLYSAFGLLTFVVFAAMLLIPNIIIWLQTGHPVLRLPEDSTSVR
ncbi:MAG: Tetracycline resistance protein, class C [candidate division WS6 bacterium OLB20]|uniref:Tetracycline resistance protein, class C n=1 Tax=candidate division WS6 bacterium OLB20 TaxID=1617426 RepID=A0A136LWQ4_9BACT|nr:MAG: Tetracycline resistance protein, class C [candidate division WS6 bacterium OLB20]